MYIVIGVLSIAILIFICILVNYKRQIKDICRQLRFLQEHESNMLITKEMQWGHIGELTELLNAERKEKRADSLSEEGADDRGYLYESFS